MNHAIVILLGIAAITIRCTRSETDSIIFLMSVINSVALMIIVYNIFKNIESAIRTRIKKHPSQLYGDKNIKYAVRWRNILLFILSIGSYLYMFMFRGTFLNDIMSIISLALSIIAESIEKWLTNIFYKKI